MAEDNVISFECVFKPLKRFQWYDPETGQLIADYLPGNTYNCTRFPVHDRLRRELSKWAREELVKIFALKPGQQFLMTTVEVEAS